MILTLFALLALLGCEDGKQPAEELYRGPSFVRFLLLVDNNEQPLQAPQVDASLVPRSAYTHRSFTNIKIPVALSLNANSDLESVTVRYELSVQGDYEGYSISPADQLTLSRTQPVDTLYLQLDSAWTVDDSVRFDLELTEDDAFEVTLGAPTEDALGKTLQIELGEVVPTYLLSTNREELTGNQGEVVNFVVNFPAGYLPGDLPDSLFQIEAGFDFSLTRLPLTDRRQIGFEVTLLESLSVDELNYESTLTLQPIDGYNLLGSPNLLLTKPALVDRDNSLFVASDFYDLGDPFYRTYGEHWFDSNDDDTCSWSSFFAFTYPVEVDASHPHAVLYDDGGNSDPSDDVYHHAFRIGFDSPNAGNTTNSFNLKRWFNGESINASNSPGFNVTEALEFFPDNGDDPNQGTVLVIPQDLVIGTSAGVSYIIAIEGDGRYQRAPDGAYELSFEIRATNATLFGGTRTDQYRLFNFNPSANPADLTDNCLAPVDL